MKSAGVDRYYTVPWFVELGDHRQVPGTAMQLTRIAALVCNRQPPMPYGARVLLFFSESGGLLEKQLCGYAVWLALELEMIGWVDDVPLRGFS